jgi:hypothetical protein
MSVNGLGSVSRECGDVRRKSVPLKLERDRVHNVHVKGDQQTNGTLVPAKMTSQLASSRPRVASTPDDRHAP